MSASNTIDSVQVSKNKVAKIKNDKGETSITEKGNDEKDLALSTNEPAPVKKPTIIKRKSVIFGLVSNPIKAKKVFVRRSSSYNNRMKANEMAKKNQRVCSEADGTIFLLS